MKKINKFLQFHRRHLALYSTILFSGFLLVFMVISLNGESSPIEKKSAHSETAAILDGQRLLSNREQTFGSYAIFDSETKWVNSASQIATDDIAGHLTLLDFWTYGCINCIHNLNDIRKLEQDYGDKLLVLGIHSGKFTNEQDSDGIKAAAARLHIDHLIVNDEGFRIWKYFGVEAWPTLILLNQRGKVIGKYIGEGNYAKLKTDIARAVVSYDGVIKHVSNNLLPEKSTSRQILNFPSKIRKMDQNFVISDSGNNRVIIVAATGKILDTITGFNNPGGTLYYNGLLYIADSGDHTIKAYNPLQKTLTIVAGNGIRGTTFYSQKTLPAVATSLASPTDITLNIAGDEMLISNSGTHQIFTFNPKSETISLVAGSGHEGIADGLYPKHSLAQTSAMVRSRVHNMIYFLDSESSSLRQIDANGNVITLIGKGLFSYGKADGVKNVALLQHPAGLALSQKEDKIYIADSYNHLIRVFDIATKTLSTYSGTGLRGNDIGDIAKLAMNEPTDILVSDNKLYITDNGNHRLLIIEQNNGKVKEFLIGAKIQQPQSKKTKKHDKKKSRHK